MIFNLNFVVSKPANVVLAGACGRLTRASMEHDVKQLIDSMV